MEEQKEQETNELLRKLIKTFTLGVCEEKNKTLFLTILEELEDNDKKNN